ncbi:hypothetical protein HDU87_001749 [Geranomyces variabilis]|uniref:Uncharacterized protein n=1 Tax=Geranomyces variabilis TaxID=109894 RepID=A0AAD5TM02_9FUNG|nr:hypothetical protein HDU87_001749 [Geranomyces variabilis]
MLDEHGKPPEPSPGRAESAPVELEGLAPALASLSLAANQVPPPRPPQKEKAKRPPKPGSKAAILLKQQQQQQQQQQKQQQTAVSSGPSTDEATVDPPDPTFDQSTGVLILSFRTPSALAGALLRPHVAYEGGHLNGPLKGVNFPSSHYSTWLATSSASSSSSSASSSSSPTPATPPTLTAAEQATAALIPPAATYICAYIRNDRSTLLHEWAHARFHVSDAYRALCVAQWAALDTATVKVVRKELEMRGYREDVYVDEWQAYCVEGPGEFGKKAGRALGEAHCVLRREVGTPPSFSRA